MTDFQTINDIVNESVKSSSYVAVVISSCVFIVYTLITHIVSYYKQKTKNKPLIEMATAIKESSDNIAKLNAVLDKTFKDAERKELAKCKVVIDLAFTNFKSKISQECDDIIAHNNIETNKNLIIENIRKIVNTEYYKLYSTLAAYEVNEINIASKLKEEWTKEVIDSVIAIIYNGQEPIFRLIQLNNRLAVCVSDYATYINNKTFNT